MNVSDMTWNSGWKCIFAEGLYRMEYTYFYFDPGSGQVGFVVDKVTLGQVFSEYFGFSCQSSFHQLLHNHPHLSSGAGTIGQKWPQYKGLSPTPLAIKENFP
jgi:hypothetical protein